MRQSTDSMEHQEQMVAPEAHAPTTASVESGDLFALPRGESLRNEAHVVALQSVAGNAAVARLMSGFGSNTLLARDTDDGAGGGRPGPQGGEGAPQGEMTLDDITLFERQSESRTWQAPMNSITIFEKVIPIPAIKFPIKITIRAEPSFETLLEGGVGAGVIRNIHAGIGGDSAKAAGELHIPADFNARAEATAALVVRGEPAKPSDEWRAEVQGSGGLNAIGTAPAMAEVNVPVQFRVEGKSAYIDAEAALEVEFKLDYSLGAVVTASIIIEEKKTPKDGGPGAADAPRSVPPTRPPRPPDAPPIELPDWLDRVLPPEDMTPKGGRQVWRHRWELKSGEKVWHFEANLKISAAGDAGQVGFDPAVSPATPDLKELTDVSVKTEDSSEGGASKSPEVDVNSLKAATHEANAARFEIQKQIYDRQKALKEPSVLGPHWWDWPQGDPLGPSWPVERPDDPRQELEQLQPLEEAAAALDDRYMATLEVVASASDDADLTAMAMGELDAIDDQAAMLRTQLDALGAKPKASSAGPTDPRYTRYALPDGRLRDDFRGKKLRPKFYGKNFSADTLDWMKWQVQDTSERQRESGKKPFEPDIPGTWWFCDADDINMWFNADVRQAAPSLDHRRPTVARHWNTIGRASDQSTRRAFFNGGGNPHHAFEIIPVSYNSQLGGREKEDMDQTVEPTFRGP
jgi:hypothetical protein